MRNGSESLAQTQPMYRPATAPSAPAVSADYSERIVAYIYNNKKITREDLGEYLITRYGTEKLELLVNKLIIEEACKAQNIDVTSQEIEADLAETVAGLNINQQEFIDKVLKAYRKNLVEWKEDIVRPKLLMTKLVQNRVSYTDQEIQMAFEAHYGERIVGRIILWPPNEGAVAQRVFNAIKDNEVEFAKTAKSQASQQLSAKEGRLEKPVGRYSTGNPALENEIFKLLPGDVTVPIQVPEGWVVFKCDERLKPDATVNIQRVRDELIKEIKAKKLQIEIKNTFEELKRQANPQLLLPGAKKTINLAPGVHEALQDVKGIPDNRPPGR